MPTITDFSVEDKDYQNTIAAEPKMTMDEVGADIDSHGHVSVTPETATLAPFSQKGSLANALDEAISNPSDDFRDETKGELEGVTTTSQSGLSQEDTDEEEEQIEPMVQQDKAVEVKGYLAEALDAITMDGAEEIEAKPPKGKDPEPDYSDYTEETASHIRYKVPNLPKSLGGSEDKPDSNGLVYVTRTFIVDPEKYVSNNYRPSNLGKIPDAASILKKKSGLLKKDQVTTEEEEEEIDVDRDEKVADIKTEQVDTIPINQKDDKKAQDELQENIALDYATFIDGSSFICYDEIAEIDYSKIAMDAGLKKAPTRANCQTTFAQCRAANPLYCRFHGPKLLEADIKTQIKAGVGSGCTVSVTKDKNSKNKFAFRLTVGCPPSKKEKVEYFINMYMTQQPGISSSQEAMKDISPNGDKGLMTQEFEMDILQADKPPKTGKNDTLQKVAVYKTEDYKAKGMKQPVVGTTPSKIEKAASEEGVEKTKEGEEEEVIESGQETTEEPAAPEVPQGQAEESKVEKPVSKPTASSVEQPSNDDEAEFDKLVNEAEEKGLFNNDDFQKKYQEIFFDGKTDMAAKVAAMKALMEKTQGQGTSGDEDDSNDGDIGEGELKNGDNDDTLDGEANSAAEILSSKTGKPIEELKKDLLARAEGETPITKTDLDFLTDSLGADNAIVRRMEDLYRSEGETRDLEELLKSARNALNGIPSADIKETAEDIKNEAWIAKEQTRIAEELEERLGTMHGSEGGLGNALAKAAIESAVGDAKDKASSSRKKADDSAKRLQKLNEESYRRVEREAKGEAAARVEKYLVEMARGIFGRDSKSETIAEEADAVSGWMEDLAKKKGVEYTPSPEFSDALEGVKKEAEQLDWLMGDLKKAMDVSGKDFQAEDIKFLSESIGRKAAKIGRMFAELNGLGLSEIARINKAAELAEQKAKLEKLSGGIQSKGGDDDGRPSEQDFYLAAMEIANSGGDVFDDAFVGLTAIVDGNVQGFGAMSSEEMTREMAGQYIEALEKGGDKFKPMVEALKGAVEKLPKEDGNDGSDTIEKVEKQAKNDDTSKKNKAKDSENETSGSSGGEMDSRIEGIYKDWVEEIVPEWVKKLSAEESKKYADMLEAARDWDRDETNTAFEELTKYEDAKSKEYDELKAKKKDESKKGKTPNGVDTSTTRKTKEEDVHEENNGSSRQEVIDASKRLGLDAFKPEGELKRLLAIAKKLADRDKRMEQRAKDIETMLADREAKKNQKSTRGTGNYAGVVEDAMPKEAAMKIVADAVVKALEG